MIGSTDPKAERREEFLQAAARIFSEKGYRASTIQDIGRELGITSAALYYYFSGKQDILSELIVRPIVFLQEMAQEVAGTPRTAQEKIAEIVHRHLDLMLSQRSLFTIFLRERVELEPKHAARLADLEERYYRSVLAILKDAKAEGVLKHVDVRLAALSLIGMTNWVLRWYRPDRALGPSEIADGLLEILAGGVFVRPESAAESRAGTLPPGARPRKGGRARVRPPAA